MTTAPRTARIQEAKELGLLSRFILADLRESDHTLGSNNCGDSSGRLDGGEQENENSLKRTDPTTTAH